MPSLLSTIWITHKINKMDGIWTNESIDGKGMIKMKARQIDSDSLSNALCDVLREEMKFEMFIDWMLREFCSESVLCFVEMCQFKELMVSVVGGGGDRKYKYVGLLYDEIPRSSIVHRVKNKFMVFDLYQLMDDDGCNKFGKIAGLLFAKYIDNDSELQVNISGGLRRKYMKHARSNWSMD